MLFVLFLLIYCYHLLIRTRPGLTSLAYAPLYQSFPSTVLTPTTSCRLSTNLPLKALLFALLSQRYPLCNPSQAAKTKIPNNNQLQSNLHQLLKMQPSNFLIPPIYIILHDHAGSTTYRQSVNCHHHPPLRLQLW